MSGQQTLARSLGYAEDQTLLIVHADDIGLTRSTNVAVMRAFEQGAITSGSVMTPCPWFPDFAAYYREHAGLDVGIHATLTAEWAYYRWGGVLPATEIPSLLDEHGYLHSTVEQVARRADPAEAEKEIRAQIERAMTLGVDPTHLDTHMGSVMSRPDLVDVYLKLGREYRLPVLMPAGGRSENGSRAVRATLAAGFPLVDGLHMMRANDPSRSWAEVYGGIIADMQPGLNQLIVHLAFDDAEMQAVTVDHPDFGSAWRQRDFDFVTSEQFEHLLLAHDVQLASWGQIRNTL